MVDIYCVQLVNTSHKSLVWYVLQVHSVDPGMDIIHDMDIEQKLQGWAGLE